MNKLKKIQTFRSSLKSGNISIGSWMQIPNASIAEIMGNANFEWVAIDMEHGSFSNEQLPDLFRALELGETMPLVRVALNLANKAISNLLLKEINRIHVLILSKVGGWIHSLIKHDYTDCVS